MANINQKSERIRLWSIIFALIIIYTAMNRLFMAYGKPIVQSISSIEFPSIFFTILSVSCLLPLIFIWIQWDKNLTWRLIFGQSKWSFWQSYHRASFYLILVFICSELLSLWVLRSFIRFEYVWNVHYWLIFLLPMIVIVFLQVFAEESLFRGVLFIKIQKLYSAETAIILPSVIWGLAHYGNINDKGLAIFLIIQMSVLGIILADWRLLTGSLIEPFMVHFFNNVFFGLIYGSNYRHYSTQIWQSQFIEMPYWGEIFYLLFPLLPMLMIYAFIRPKLIKF